MCALFTILTRYCALTMDTVAMVNCETAATANQQSLQATCFSCASYISYIHYVLGNLFLFLLRLQQYLTPSPHHLLPLLHANTISCSFSVLYLLCFRRKENSTYFNFYVFFCSFRAAGSTYICYIVKVRVMSFN